MAAKKGKLEVRCETELLNKYKLAALSLGSNYRQLTLDAMEAVVDGRMTIIKSESMKKAEKVFK